MIASIGKDIGKQWRIVVLSYAMQLALAMLIGLQVYHELDAGFGDSMASAALLEGFDRTALTDMVLHHGDSMLTLLGQLRWVVLIWVVVYLFIQAGMIGVIVHGEWRVEDFFKRGVRHYGAVAKLSAMGLVVILLWSAIVFGGFAMIGGNPMGGLVSEKPWVWGAGLTLALWTVGLVAIWVPFYMAKCQAISKGLGSWAALREGWASMAGKRRRIALWVLAVVALHGLLAAVGACLSEDRGAGSWAVVVGVLAGQQILHLSRWVIKFCYYHGLYRLIK